MGKRDSEILSHGIQRLIRRELSYRSSKNIPKKVIKTLEENIDRPRVRHLALILYKNGVNLKDCLKICKGLKELPDPKPRKKEKIYHAIKEFKFQGFVPMSKIKICSRYAYITTNFLVNGEYLIHPKKFGHHINTLKRGYPLIENEFPYYGVIGYTKIMYEKGA